MSEYCTECGAHENAWGTGPVMDELTDTIARLRALLERARDRVEWVAENFPDDRGSRAYALLAEIDAALRREG